MLSPSVGCGWMVLPISTASAAPISIACCCHQCRCAPPELHAAGLARRVCCAFPALSCAAESTCYCGQRRRQSSAHAAYLQTGTASACPYAAVGANEILVKVVMATVEYAQPAIHSGVIRLPTGGRERRKFVYHHSIVRHSARAHMFALALPHARCRPPNALASARTRATPVGRRW